VKRACSAARASGAGCEGLEPGRREGRRGPAGYVKRRNEGECVGLAHDGGAEAVGVGRQNGDRSGPNPELQMRDAKRDELTRAARATPNGIHWRQRERRPMCSAPRPATALLSRPPAKLTFTPVSSAICKLTGRVRHVNTARQAIWSKSSVRGTTPSRRGPPHASSSHTMVKNAVSDAAVSRPFASIAAASSVPHDKSAGEAFQGQLHDVTCFLHHPPFTLWARRNSAVGC
jgi:hypothetical protein